MLKKAPIRQCIGPLALLFCVAVLSCVYYSAVDVGSNATDRRREALLRATQKKLDSRRESLANCTSFVTTFTSGQGSMEALRAAQDEVEAMQRAIVDSKDVVSKSSRVLDDCQRRLKQLKVALRGTAASNAEDVAAKLRQEETELKEKVSFLEKEAAAAHQATSAGIRNLQSALFEAAFSLRNQAVAESCADLYSREAYSVVFDIGSTGNRIHVYRFAYPEDYLAPNKSASSSLPAAAKRLSAPPYSSSQIAVMSDVEQDDVLADVALRDPPPFQLPIWDMKLKSEYFQQNRIRMSEQETKQSVIAALDELMSSGVATVPQGARRCTPVEFKATAGLRKKGLERAAVTLKMVRDYYANTSSLWVRGESPARILEGKEEGPLAWITVNYLLGNFKAGSSGETAAIIDLGGGSTQIVFEPARGAMPASVEKEDLFSDLALGDRKVLAYQHSYDGLGLNEARSELLMQVQGMCAGPIHHQRKPGKQQFADDGEEEDEWNEVALEAQRRLRAQALADGYVGSPTHEPNLTATRHFPCFPLGYSDALGVANLPPEADPTAEPGDNGRGHTPDFDQCVQLFRRYVLNRKEGADCPADDCGMWGIPQPSMAKFTGPIYAFSYIHDYTKPYQDDPESEKLTVAAIGAIAKKRCDALTMDEANKRREHAGKMGAKPEYECLHLSYIYALLRHGYGIPDYRELTIAKRIHGFETAWTLGSALTTLSSLSV